MSEITDFLRARYAEQRQAAVNAALTEGLTGSLVDFLKHEAARVDVGPSEQHYALQTPGYVIADLDAKLRILNEVVPEIDAMEDRIDGEWGAGDPTERESMTLLRLLAQPFAGHPDHKGEEWAP